VTRSGAKVFLIPQDVRKRSPQEDDLPKYVSFLLKQSYTHISPTMESVRRKASADQNFHHFLSCNVFGQPNSTNPPSVNLFIFPIICLFSLTSHGHHHTFAMPLTPWQKSSLATMGNCLDEFGMSVRKSEQSLSEVSTLSGCSNDALGHCST